MAPKTHMIGLNCMLLCTLRDIITLFLFFKIRSLTGQAFKHSKPYPDFQLQSGIPGIIGALDGTHIRLYSAPKGDRDYFNRKQFPSIQLQVLYIYGK